MKRILMLGGAFAQIPAIQYAKNAGYYVITCDYLPDNPGHRYADEYHNISTTDLDGVLNLAASLDIDGIVAYASDPAAMTASYVAEELGLPGNPLEVTRILSEKDHFREFLRDHNFNTPKAQAFSEGGDVALDPTLSWPLIVKPVDSSGSKGVTIIREENELDDAISYALDYSRAKKAIVEEYIDSPIKQIHGDCFVLDGSMIMCCLGDHHFRDGTLAPYSTTLPSTQNEETIKRIEDEIVRFISLSGFKNGAINIEARIGFDDKVYLIDIGARNGGNFIPQLVHCATGFDEVGATIEAALGDYDMIENSREYPVRGCYSYYVIGSTVDGKIKDIRYSEKIQGMIVQENLYKKPGDTVDCFKNSGNTIGVLILRYKDMFEMKKVINSIDEHVKVVVERSTVDGSQGE
jgi:biotin carboxylase